jgi:hypothetical protein
MENSVYGIMKTRLWINVVGNRDRSTNFGGSVPCGY